MFKDKNYGLDKDLINAVKNIIYENKEEDGVPVVKAPKTPDKTKPEKTPKAVKDAADEAEKKGLTELNFNNVKESAVIAKFSKYLDENFHVEQLTEEEIQWIYENEFYNQLDERTWNQYWRGLSNYQADVEDEFKGSESPLEKSGRSILGAAMRRQGPTNKTTRNGIVEKPVAGESDASRRERASRGDFNPRLPLVKPPSMTELDDDGEDSDTPISKIKSDIEQAKKEVNQPTPATPPAAKATPPAAKARRRNRTNRDSGGESWAQRQHRLASTQDPDSVFTPKD